MIPQTKDELIQRILEDLGSPVIKINIARAQLENSVDDAMAFWEQWHHEAQEHSYMKIVITEDMLKTNTVKLSESVFGVLSIIDPTANGNLGWMSYEFEMTKDAMYDSMQAGSGGSGAGAMMVATKQYLADLKKMTVAPIPFDYRRWRQELVIFDDMSKYWKAGDIMLIEVMGFLYKSGYNVWGDEALRKLATAYAKKYWGQNIKKFSGVSLPGGTMMNGDTIYNDAISDIEKQEQYIMGLQNPLGIVLL